MNWKEILRAWTIEALFRGDIDRAEFLDNLRTCIDRGNTPIIWVDRDDLRAMFGMEAS